MIRGVRAAKRGPSWQDLRAVRSRKAVCGAFRMHSAHILPKPAHFGCMARESCRELAIFPSETTFGMHGAQNLPRIAARERISRVFCHRQAPGNAPRRNLVAARHSGTHRASILPLPVRPRAHQGAVPPPSDAGERISRAFCHRRAPGNAPWRNLATASRPKTHSRRSCHGRTPGFAPHQITAALPAKKTAPKAGLGERPLSEVRKTECWRGWDEQRGTARCSAIAEHSGTHRGGISPWPITRPETKEGEHFARLLLLFCLRLEWPSGPSR